MVADTRVLYSRSQADLDRFNSLKNRIKALMQPENRGYMVKRALEEFCTTSFQLGQMRLALAKDDVPGLQWAGWKFMGSAINCLALINQTYFSKGWGGNTEQILRMTQKPNDLERMLNGILQPGEPDEILNHAQHLADEVRAILLIAQASQAKPSAPQDEFKDFYYYIHEYKNKVLKACQNADAFSANSAAFHLQELICVLMNKVKAGFYGEDFNLLSEYASSYHKAGFPDLLEPSSRGDYQALARRVMQLDCKIKAWFDQHSIDLNILENEGQLKCFLNQRDPLLQ